MNILSKLTIKNLMLNKKRTIGTIIGIVLSSALICAVSGMFASFRETLIKNTIEGSGYYHIALNGINLDKLNSVKLNKDVLDVYTLYELGVANYAVDDEANIDLYVYSLDKDNFDNLAYKIIEGSFPSNSNEVLISENLMERTDLKVGDYIEFDISDSGVRSHKKYKIVGSTYRRRNSTGNLVITTDVKNDNIWAYVALKNVSDYKDSFVELLGVFDYDDILEDKVVGIDYVINNELLRWEVFAFSDNTISMLVIVVAVVICIIVIVSIFCIRNSFAISTTEKMKMYGMLASVGATRKQIRKSVLLEGVLLGIVGIPLGILLGILAVWVLLKIVNIFLGSFLFNNIEGLVFKISVMPILVVVILGFVTIYFSSISSARKASRVSPIDNLRNSEKIKLSAKNLKTPKIISLVFKMGGVLAYKNLKRSKKKYRTTVISITISVFVFISMFYFINVGFKQAGMYYNDYKYDILVYLDKDSDIKSLQNMSYIESSYVLYDFAYGGRVKDYNKINRYKDNNENYDDLYINIVAVDNKVFREYVKRLKLNYNEVLNKGILINDLSYWSNTKKKNVIVDRYSYLVGDTVFMEYEDRDGIKNGLDIELGGVTGERPIGLEDYYYQGGYIIINKDSYKNLECVASKFLIKTDKDKDLMKQIEEIDNTLSANNLTETARNERAMVIVISIFLYGFIMVISLIGVTNIFNTLTSNMELRQKEFAMLKSIGMTKREFRRMINLETLFYSCKSLFYGIILGLIGSYFIYLGFNVHTVRNFEIPYKGILMSIVFVFAIVYIIMRYSMGKINKQNTIETIRNENI